MLLEIGILSKATNYSSSGRFYQKKDVWSLVDVGEEVSLVDEIHLVEQPCFVGGNVKKVQQGLVKEKQLFGSTSLQN